MVLHREVPSGGNLVSSPSYRHIATSEKAMLGIPQNGMICVSWSKKASGVRTNMSADEVRGAAIPLGPVDVKVCAVDDTWSGLKLMIRRSQRK